MNPVRRRASERGSALLIVLVVAAMIAIMLYRELPVATFEAQRQKEELLMDRGNEYKRAVQLYVRKIQSFPPSLDALENTNRMRFLRSRYVDPFTGKNDWRLLHAGPGGVITDSKIKKAVSTLNGAPGSTGSGTTLGAAAASAQFSNSINFASTNGQTAGAGNNFPQRPPAMSANGGGAGSGNTDMFSTPNGQAVDPQTSNQANPAAPYPGYPGPPDMSNPLANGGSGTYPMPGSGRFRGGVPTGSSYPAVPSGPQNPQDTMQSALGNQNPPPTVNYGGAGTGTDNSSSNGSFSNGSFSTGSSFGPQAGANAPNGSPGMGSMNPSTMGGGIAGVASKSPGKTIKTLNDQTERTLWEFVYDMQKEAAANAPGLGNNGNGGINNTGGINNIGGNNNTGGSNNSFNNNNGGSSLFGGGSTTNAPTSNSGTGTTNQ
jgi:hypothetical protein